ncbi:MAG: YqeG family HAD IIIA-type phosphatase [Armatimonadetes bacterium]|nr:YqeG family HAD IIIA-type phosphatase [Armatimonadota bacterium]
MSLLKPDLVVCGVLELTPKFLDAHRIRGLILDADNTLVPRSRYELPADVIDWIEGLQASGRRLCILSNSAHVRRVAAMVEPYGMTAISMAQKPFRSGFRRALAGLGTAPAETAMVGDQLFTDILGGNAAGLLTVLVRPITGSDFVGYRPVRPLERWLLRRWEARETAARDA